MTRHGCSQLVLWIENKLKVLLAKTGRQETTHDLWDEKTHSVKRRSRELPTGLGTLEH